MRGYSLLQPALSSVCSIGLRDLEKCLSISVTHGCCCHLNICMPVYMFPCEKGLGSHILMCFTFSQTAHCYIHAAALVAEYLKRQGKFFTLKTIIHMSDFYLICI